MARTGASTLIEQADQQISVDGIYFEQSTCYQRYTCDIYLHFLQLAGRNGLMCRRARASMCSAWWMCSSPLRRPDGIDARDWRCRRRSLMPLALRAAPTTAAASLPSRERCSGGRLRVGRRRGGAEVVWLLGRRRCDGIHARRRRRARRRAVAGLHQRAAMR